MRDNYTHTTLILNCLSLVKFDQSNITMQS